MDKVWKAYKFLLFMIIFLFIFFSILKINFLFQIEEIGKSIDLSRLLKNIIHFR